MLIGELSQRTGVSRRLLRYYGEQGLLESGRTAGGYRVYDSDAVRSVRAVRALLALGLTTETIASVLPCVRDPEADPVELELCPDLVATIRAEVAALDARIGALTERRGALSARLAGC